ncbi:hypothetical protein F2P81_011078 [Scophthalmus maximus]|uniref:Uncharacterized protein n=1 Tax=Scophthalmus maximus TaxID=52904 RepID=A0A6A4SKJ6_SCOMX|nr:hypothetical protein F2P81_011078 [Scophthalmus maximus]
MNYFNSEKSAPENRNPLKTVITRNQTTLNVLVRPQWEERSAGDKRNLWSVTVSLNIQYVRGEHRPLVFQSNGTETAAFKRTSGPRKKKQTPATDDGSTNRTLVLIQNAGA